VHPESGRFGKIPANPPETALHNDAIINHSGTNFSFPNGTGNDPDATQLSPVQEPPGNGTEPLTPGNGTEPSQPTAGQVPGNGADPAPVNSGSLAAMIRLMAATHRDWSPERLAKASGQPVSAVKRALGRNPRNGLAGGIH
jgi:hypothetical protein